MRVAIIGSRSWTDRTAITKFVAALPRDVEVVSGGAQGVDTQAVLAAHGRGMRVLVFPPKFKASGKYNVGDYHARNREIVDYADKVIAFALTPTPGTTSTLRYCYDLGKPYMVVPFGCWICEPWRYKAATVAKRPKTSYEDGIGDAIRAAASLGGNS